MFRLFAHKKVSDLFLYYTTGFILIAVVFLGAVYSFLQVDKFDHDTRQLRSNFVEEQKERVKLETEKVVNFINLTRFSLDENMRNNIRMQVEKAWKVMENIYDQNAKSRTKGEIKKMIKDALRPIRFYNGRGYYFIVSMDGTEELYPVAPQFEGENLTNLQDLKGNYVIKDEMEVIENLGEGFVTDYWTKPGKNEKMIYPKTSFVKVFKPLNWYVGCGEYLDNFEKDLQEQVKMNIRNIRFGKYGYVFVDSYTGFAVVIDSPVFEEGDYVGDLVDANGLKILEEQRKVALQPGGGFVEYLWPKPGKVENAHKISYVYGYDDWQWVIGAGTYLDEIDDLIAEKRSQLHRQMWQQLLLSLSVMIVIVTILIIITKRISEKIKANFEIFTSKLKIAVASGQALDVSDYSLTDISATIGSINKILAFKKEAEKELEASEVRFRAIVENIPVMIVVLDKNDVFRIGNNEVANFFRLMPGTQLSISYFESLLTNAPENANAQIIYTQLDGKFRELELKTELGVRTQNWTAFKTRTNEIIIVGYDITEIKQNQLKLKELNDTKDKFFSIISHDLRSPFNVIIGYSDLLIQDYYHYADDDRLQFIETINASAMATLNLLDNLLSWARTQSGSIVTNMETFNLGVLVKTTFTLLLPQAQSKSIRLENNISENTVVFADQDMVSTIFQNLISNSIKFTKNGGLINIESSPQEGFLKISVSDNGIGIPEKIASGIFHISGDISRSGTNNEKGTGLGLVICKEFVEKMGGKIWLESEAGKGTTFYFTLKLP